ncbi:MAG: beta-propeller fold lactonase family protein [Candidatus Dormibacteraeota bacterium]|nr:beta-propeller fold lactonase family protein [Candidatus Dormibacteraeota bacterium]
MRRAALRLFSVAVTVAALAVVGTVQPAHALIGEAVFVQTNDPGGNSIVAYERRPGGGLLEQAVYGTGGLGGRASGSVVDPLASEGSVVLDRPAGLLFAVNAGSDSLSVFRVLGDRLHLDQVVPSGGAFPVGVAVSGHLLYVLNGGSSGSVSGFRIAGGFLEPIRGSERSLGLAGDNPPFYLASPGQIGFSPDGGKLVVTTKTNGLVDVFSVNPSGRLSEAPATTAVGGNPFSFVFDPAGRLALVNAADNSLGTYAINRDGTLTAIGAPVSDGQAAACWITVAGGVELVANAGSGTISSYRINRDGSVSLLNPAAASGIPGAIDMAASGPFLYAQSGGSASVDAYRVGDGGSLSLVQSTAVPDGADQEGIAAG